MATAGATTEKLPLIRHAYSPPYVVAIDCSQGGMTQQNFKDECDVNRIMARVLETGVMPELRDAIPQYADVTGIDFQAAQDLVLNASEMFNELPAKIRDRFSNSPALFLDFAGDPANQKEMAELGLLSPEATKRVLEPPPPPAPPAPPKTP